MGICCEPGRYGLPSPWKTSPEVIFMPKKGMARPEWTHPQPRNEAAPVPEIQGKAKHGKEPARPIISGTGGPSLKVFHDRDGEK